MTLDLTSVLVFRAQSTLCAVPLLYVVETMRPLPIEELKDVPTCVRGLSIVRGYPLPVLDAGSLLGLSGHRPIRRFVTLRVSERRTTALAVDDVLGIRELDRLLVQQLPSVLQSDHAEAIEGISILDGELLIVLRATKMIPEELWQTLGFEEGV